VATISILNPKDSLIPPPAFLPQTYKYTAPLVRKYPCSKNHMLARSASVVYAKHVSRFSWANKARAESVHDVPRLEAGLNHFN
jgi:hypothetical protein